MELPYPPMRPEGIRCNRVTDELSDYQVIYPGKEEFYFFRVFDKESYVIAVSPFREVLLRVFDKEPEAVYFEGQEYCQLIFWRTTRQQIRNKLRDSKLRIMKYDKRLVEICGDGWYDNRLGWIEAVRQAEEKRKKELDPDESVF